MAYHRLAEDALRVVLESGFLSLDEAVVGVFLVYVLSFIWQPIVEPHLADSSPSNR